MDPIGILLAYLSAKFPWLMPAVSAYIVVGPIVVHAMKWEATRAGHFVLSTSFDIWGSLKGPRRGDPRPGDDVPAPMFPPPDVKP